MWRSWSLARGHWLAIVGVWLVLTVVNLFLFWIPFVGPLATTFIGVSVVVCAYEWALARN